MMEGGQTSIGAMAIIKGAGALAISLVFCVAAFLLNWEMTLFTVAFGAVLALAYRQTGRRAAAHGKQLAVKSADIGNQVADVMGNLKFFKSTGSVDKSERLIVRIFREFAITDFWAMFYRGLTKFFEGGGILFVSGILLFSIATTSTVTASTLVFLAIFYRLQPRLLIVQEIFSPGEDPTAVVRSVEGSDGRCPVPPGVRPWRCDPRLRFGVEVRDLSFVFPGDWSRSSTTCRGAWRRGAVSPSSVSRAPGRRPCSMSSADCSSRLWVRCSSTANHWAPSTSIPGSRRSVWCCRRARSSTRPCSRTSPGTPTRSIANLAPEERRAGQRHRVHRRHAERDRHSRG